MNQVQRDVVVSKAANADWQIHDKHNINATI
jgi:hypothetical protein